MKVSRLGCFAPRSTGSWPPRHGFIAKGRYGERPQRKHLHGAGRQTTSEQIQSREVGTHRPKTSLRERPQLQSRSGRRADPGPVAFKQGADSGSRHSLDTTPDSSLPEVDCLFACCGQALSAIPDPSWIGDPLGSWFGSARQRRENNQRVGQPVTHNAARLAWGVELQRSVLPAGRPASIDHGIVSDGPPGRFEVGSTLRPAHRCFNPLEDWAASRKSITVFLHASHSRVSGSFLGPVELGIDVHADHRTQMREPRQSRPQ